MLIITLSLLFISGCGAKNKMHENLKNFQFTCLHEADVFPPLDPEADTWFKQAVQLSRQDNPDLKRIAQLYRQAAEKDHYIAIGNLQVMISEGDAEPVAGKLPQEEVIDLVERLINMEIPFGYYIMGTYLQEGYGVEQDENAAFSYMLKAAIMGNPEGQYVIGDKFMDAQVPELYRLDLGRAMLDCASKQGFSKASFELGLHYVAAENNYTKALFYLQEGAKQGNTLSLFLLSQSFKTTDINNRLYYLGQKIDLERVRRYDLISDEIDNNPRAKFPDIDKIVPLPPAPLPEWDGTFEYKKQAQ
ncbi:DUF6396 domain-containing protein [Proteus sp. NMG38-2]|uniref:SEL1-like repeat protein n=1 Tax=Proteus sp. NMG38-2 TaxID=2883107 RepID=UPI001D09FF9E|nr:DUF6396 domain-containing protein [Proteus sp. NMG38-2]UDN35968.1 sel1 repeat family protein [Proteus sp. NMG38-2]